jgi:hypothetical protein
VLLSKYYLGNKIKKNEMGETYGTYGDRRGVYRVLVGRSEGKRQLGKPKSIWEHNIVLHLQEVNWKGMD